MKKRKKKHARSPILAAGGIVFRHGARPLVAIVQRRKDGRWVLPKGKLKRHESNLKGARREAVEETGQKVHVHEFLGVLSYGSSGKPKITRFWRMESRGDTAHGLQRDIKAVEWLSLKDAIDQLSLPVEKMFLSEIGRGAMRAARTASKSRRRRGAVRRTAAKPAKNLFSRLFGG